MRKFAIWKSDGSRQVIEGETGTAKKTKNGITVKIDSKVVQDAIGFMEIIDRKDAK
jgi:predicted transcriptional regulator